MFRKKNEKLQKNLVAVRRDGKKLRQELGISKTKKESN